MSRELVVFVSGRDCSRMRLIDSTQNIRFSFAREETNEITTSVLWRDVVCGPEKARLWTEDPFFWEVVLEAQIIIYSTSINTILMSINIGINGFGRIGR